MTELNQELVKDLFDYDSSTGIFYHAKNKGKAKKGEVAGGYHKHTKAIYLRINGKKELAHRIAWLYEYGLLPQNQLDHINHDRSDNRITNLREVTHSENMKNKSKYKNNQYGVTGISKDKRCGKFRAYININGKPKGVGYYDEFNDAVVARNQALKQVGEYHDNHGI